MSQCNVNTFGADGLDTWSDVVVVVVVDGGLGDNGADFKPPTRGEDGGLAVVFEVAAAGFDMVEAAGFFNPEGLAAGLAAGFPFSPSFGLSSPAFSATGSLGAAGFLAAAVGTEGLLDTLGRGGFVVAGLAGATLAIGLAGAFAAGFLIPDAAGLAVGAAGFSTFSTFFFFSTRVSLWVSSLCLTSSCSV